MYIRRIILAGGGGLLAIVAAPTAFAGEPIPGVDVNLPKNTANLKTALNDGNKTLPKQKALPQQKELPKAAQKKN